MQKTAESNIGEIHNDDLLFNLQRIDLTRNLLRAEIALLDRQFDEIVVRCNQNNIKENDFLYLNCKVSERRSVHIPSFIKLFPEAAKTLKETAIIRTQMEFGKVLDDLKEKGITKINVKDAEDLVGRIPLQPAVVISKTEVYTIVEKNQDRE